MLGLGYPEMILILLAVLVIFGPKKLPEIGKGIGEGLRALKQSTEEKDEKTDSGKAKSAADAQAAESAKAAKQTPTAQPEGEEVKKDSAEESAEIIVNPASEPAEQKPEGKA